MCRPRVAAVGERQGRLTRQRLGPDVVVRRCIVASRSGQGPCDCALRHATPGLNRGRPLAATAWSQQLHAMQRSCERLASSKPQPRPQCCISPFNPAPHSTAGAQMRSTHTCMVSCDKRFGPHILSGVRSNLAPVWSTQPRIWSAPLRTCSKLARVTSHRAQAWPNRAQSRRSQDKVASNQDKVASDLAKFGREQRIVGQTELRILDMSTNTVDSLTRPKFGGTPALVRSKLPCT